MPDLTKMMRELPAAVRDASIAASPEVHNLRPLLAEKLKHRIAFAKVPVK